MHITHPLTEEHLVTMQAPATTEGIDLDALTLFLSEHVDGGLKDRLAGRLIAGGRSNPTYELTDGTRAWILRRPPLGNIMQSTHDVIRESTVVRALHGSRVPVAHVAAQCITDEVIGAPFYVMDKIEGVTLRNQTDTARLTTDQRSALSTSFLDTLVSLHQIKPVEVGLQEFGRPVGYLERQLRRWGRQYETIKTRDNPAVSRLIERLKASLPDLRFPGIVHGDYKLDNVMVDREDPSTILALLDWEMATVGDTLADLGQLISFWDEVDRPHNPVSAGTTAHPGFPRADEMMGDYAERRRIEVADVEWYVVFADLKLAVILEQIHARHLAGSTVGDGFDDLGAMVDPLLDRALSRASHSHDVRLRG